jgi:hypothetical protein
VPQETPQGVAPPREALVIRIREPRGRRRHAM